MTMEIAFAWLLVNWEVKSFLVSILPDVLESFGMDGEGRIEDNDCYFLLVVCSWIVSGWTTNQFGDDPLAPNRWKFYGSD